MDISGLISSLWNGLDLKPKDLLTFLIVALIVMSMNNRLLSIENSMVSTNENVEKIHALQIEQENRYFDDIEQSADQVLATLQKKKFSTPEEISDFLESKPAGKTNLEKGVKVDRVYEKLYQTYGDLARISRIAVKL